MRFCAGVTGVVAGILLAAVSWAEGYASHPEARTLMQEMVAEHGFELRTLEALFGQAKKKQSILDAISRAPEKTKPWKEYRTIFLTRSRIKKGVEFWRDNHETLARAEQTFGVPGEIIVAIIGVETRYGRQAGNYRVLDALSTLAFDYPQRATFFRKELQQFLLLTREQERDPLELKGSYAGAMGYGQFMPSSYRNYAVDFDGDNFSDIWDNPVDAIGSVANYFKKHGWKSGHAVVFRAHIDSQYDRDVINHSLKPTHTIATLQELGFTPTHGHAPQEQAMAIRLQGEYGTEFWLGLSNFYVITRYNRSRLYAMAVYQLSEEIKQRAVQEKIEVQQEQKQPRG